jgi:hypothetical protein
MRYLLAAILFAALPLAAQTFDPRGLARLEKRGFQRGGAEERRKTRLRIAVVRFSGVLTLVPFSLFSLCFLRSSAAPR